jgi:hypothetical protein
MVVLLLRPTKTNATQGRHALATLQLP